MTPDTILPPPRGFEQEIRPVTEIARNAILCL